MDAHTKQSLPLILESWKKEDRDLGTHVDEVRCWMQELSQLGVPHFGETAMRLRPLRERLEKHFKLEDQVLSQLELASPDLAEEIGELHTHSTRGHNQLLAKLDDLSQRLSAPEPPFDSWQDAMQEIEMFVDLLSKHEQDEAASFEKIFPS